MKICSVILCAGKGSRMKSDIPKPFHKIAGMSMLDWVINANCSINPKKMTCSLKILEIKNIVKNTKIILYDSIKKGGSSIKDFNDISGKKGNFQQSFMVYDRESKDCMKKTCRSKIKKIYISNRSTLFCKNCQK